MPPLPEARHSARSPESPREILVIAPSPMDGAGRADDHARAAAAITTLAPAANSEATTKPRISPRTRQPPSPPLAACTLFYHTANRRQASRIAVSGVGDKGEWFTAVVAGASEQQLLALKGSTLVGVGQITTRPASLTQVEALAGQLLG